MKHFTEKKYKTTTPKQANYVLGLKSIIANLEKTGNDENVLSIELKLTTDNFFGFEITYSDKETTTHTVPRYQ